MRERCKWWESPTRAEMANAVARIEHRMHGVMSPTAPFPDPVIDRADLWVLLSCARRCEAIDSVCSSDLDQARDWADIIKGDVPQGLFAAVIDSAAESQSLRSERDALARRVETLEATDFMAYTNELVAESTRLRAENERLEAMLKGAESVNEGERRMHDNVCDVNAKLRASLTAAQDRVRELEERMREASLIVNGKWPAEQVDRLLFLLRPIVPGSERTMETIIDHTGAVVSCRERPSYIPPDCQHFEKLPSGLWAWVDKNCVRIQDKDDGQPWFLFCAQAERADVGLDWMDEPDFLAARALGVRVLGWKS